MLISCTIGIVYNETGYQSVRISDMMKTIIFDCGIIEIDFTLVFYIAKTNWHIINFADSCQQFVIDNPEYCWQSSKYGEHIIKCDKESV